MSIYADHQNNLRYADADARRMYQQLKSMGVPENNMTILTNAKATRQAIVEAARYQFSKASLQDEIIFFFSGHGGDGFLAATDVPHYLYYNNIKIIFKACKAHQKILFVDACYSGGIKDQKVPAGFNGETGKFDELVNSEHEVVVFSASRYNQISAENTLYHGYFTYFLIKAFKGKADSNNNGGVTFKEMFDYVNTNVMKVSKRKQTPVMFGQFDPDRNIFRVRR